ncbi:secretion protein EspA [Shewanella surugensis]|uniref:Secretion protein EspA n=1 Tax=Shewanella surugensis TaxID=212020 RepID=A0ABT0L8J9_9GAMM|nr:secretion protein EspA [Shewanella surugensis]MCL1123700.1 secretion protein EspA [Shewanella surugensis]
MSTVINTNSIRDQNRTDYQQNYISRQGDNVLSRGIAVMYMFMNLLSEMADSMYAGMQSQSDITREAQSMANRVDSAIAKAAKDGDKGEAWLDADVYNYMQANNITVNGMSISEYANTAGGGNTRFDQGELKSIKSALETVSNQASDYVSQSQLQLQKLMQTYNVTVSLINSMQTMLADMNKSIAQNIR